MKKLFLTLLAALTVLTISQTQTVEAAFDPYELTWYVDNDGTDYWLVGWLLMPDEGVDSLTLELPLNPYQTIDNGGMEAHIEFTYDDIAYTNAVLNFADYFRSDAIEEWYDISLTTFDLELTTSYVDLYNSDGLIIYIPLTTNGTFDHSDMLTYYESEAVLTWYTNPPDWRDIYLYRDSTTLLTTQQVVIPATTDSLVLNYAYNAALLATTVSGNKSRVRIFDSSGLNLLDTFYLEDYVVDDSNYLILPFDLDSYAYTPERYSLMLYMPADQVSMWRIDFLNRNIYFDISAELMTVKFYSAGSLVETQRLPDTEIPVAPSDPTPPSGFVFLGWYDEDGSLYEFDSLPPVDAIHNDTFILTAKYRASGAIDEVDYDDPTADTDNPFYTLASGLGLATDAGFTFVYLVITAILIVGLLMLGLPTFATMVVAIIVTTIFTFFGFLPFMVSLFAYIVLIVATVGSFTGGATNE